jgi:predicted Zn-dependent protease with MMP-like domain
MTSEEFEKIAAQAVKSLPPKLRGALVNMVLAVKRLPTKAQDREFGRGLMGLYEGVPLPDRGTGYSGAMPDKITLFKDNIEAECSSRAELKEEIRRTVIHELAHYFGMDDEELEEKGLY